MVFCCVTFQKWVAKLTGFAIINAWQHFGNRKLASHNNDIIDIKIGAYLYKI